MRVSGSEFGVQISKVDRSLVSTWGVFGAYGAGFPLGHIRTMLPLPRLLLPTPPLRLFLLPLCRVTGGGFEARIDSFGIRIWGQDLRS